MSGRTSNGVGKNHSVILCSLESWSAMTIARTAYSRDADLCNSCTQALVIQCSIPMERAFSMNPEEGCKHPWKGVEAGQIYDRMRLTP